MIDLHLHLDGSLTSDDVEYLAHIQQVQLPEGFEKKICVPSYCLSLNDYLKRFTIPLSVLQSKETLKAGTKRLLDRLQSQGLIYVEIRFAPQFHTKLGLTQKEVVQAVLEGRKESSLKSNLILCCMRNDRNGKKNRETIDLAKEFLNKGVVAIDLAGAEGLYPTSMFEPLFNYAKEQGVPFVIHAGEADGVASMQSALDFGAKRIGHGVRAIRSEKLMERLKESQIPLEMCITSEVQTKAISSLEACPLKPMLEKGLNITINTDDMGISNITLNSEFALIKNHFKIHKPQIKKLIMNSLKASFLSEEEKKELKKEFESKFDSWYSSLPTV